MSVTEKAGEGGEAISKYTCNKLFLFLSISISISIYLRHLWVGLVEHARGVVGVEVVLVDQVGDGGLEALGEIEREKER